MGEFNSHTLSSSLVAQVDWNDERFVPLVVYEVAGAAVCRLYLGEHMQQRHAISAACAACQHMRIALWDAPDAIT